ncbi:hypothetical protein O0I10_004721 [Lichtheimia ornata]|uniref:Telomerase reverse transcriptase n=1 Tax=Lichtheimia ornata TaxID=688661 RepID=A0AAD7Y006_9FUNG|nr:uncharacterized protein O0I10_004721 [Lichtheimia ornata]KAJ8659361.1 hypothetical protein O0I10_004721 [Lichtheimia ornata]
MTFRTPTNVIDRRQLTYTTSTAIGRFNGKKKRLRSINDIMHQVIQRHKKVNLLNTLYATCAVPGQRDTVERMASSHKAVCAFIIKQLQQVFPPEFWGSRHNYAVILEGIRKLVMMRKRETVRVPYLLRGFKVSQCTWLGSSSSGIVPSDMKVRINILSQVMHWFYQSYLIPLMRSCFHITEGSSQGNKLFYFRRDVWDQMSHSFFNQLSFRFEPVDKVHTSERHLGASPLKLIPKGDTFRTITNMKNAVLPSSGARKDNNHHLRIILTVLQFEKTQNPGILGSTVISPKDLWERLTTYKRRMKDRTSSYHFFKADIKRCFDSIEQDRLLLILEDLLQDKRYAIRWKDKETKGTLARGLPLIVYFDDWSRMSKSDKTQYWTYSGDNLLSLLKEHIKANTIKYRSKFYRQKIGIPQGSCLSSLLCSYFYACMERQYLSFIQSDREALLLRYVDDFLLITPNQETINAFATFVLNGAKDFGCEFNAQKSMSTMRIEANDSITVCTTPEFPWCGYLFHKETLDVFSDYTRYSNTGMNDLLTVNYTPTASDLIHKATQAIKLKQQLILTDPSYNCTNTLYRNAYERYLLAAVKLSVYCKELWIADGKRPLPPMYLYDVAKQIYERTYDASKSVDRDMERGLFIRAFITVFQRCPQLFSGVIDLLHDALLEIKNRHHISRMISSWPETGL